MIFAFRIALTVIAVVVLFGVGSFLGGFLATLIRLIRQDLKRPSAHVSSPPLAAMALPPRLAQSEYCLDCGQPFELDPSDPDGIVAHEHG